MKSISSALLVAAVFALVGASGCAPKPYDHESMSGASDAWAGKFESGEGEVVFLSDAKAANNVAVEVPTDYWKNAPKRDDQHCVLDVELETDEPARKSALDTLNGAWKKYVEGGSGFGGPGYMKFRFDQKASSAFSSSSGILDGDKSITYKKLCLSKPLKRKDGYNGMRVVEMLAENNEGAAMFAFKTKARRDDPKKPVLLLTKYNYLRWAQDSKTLTSVEEIFRSYDTKELGVRVMVYLQE